MIAFHIIMTDLAHALITEQHFILNGNRKTMKDQCSRRTEKEHIDQRPPNVSGIP